MNKTKDGYEIIGEEVRNFWKNQGFVEEVIAFFYQKYDSEDKWEWCEELIECHGDCDFENMTFLNDFWEGQECIKDITIVPLRQVTEFYADKHKLREVSE